jgi:hypothetical protein
MSKDFEDVFETSSMNDPVIFNRQLRGHVDRVQLLLADMEYYGLTSVTEYKVLAASDYTANNDFNPEPYFAALKVFNNLTDI